MKDAKGAEYWAAVASRYQQDGLKMVRADGAAQYAMLDDEAPTSRLGRLARDPWADHGELDARPPRLADGDSVRVLVIGAGFGGLLHAVRLVQAGIAASKIRIVDKSGGFGGTWYWNRFPGISCDIQASIYLSLLEETGFMPSQRLSHGTEVRRYAETMAAHWKLSDQAVFRTRADWMVWEPEAARWRVGLRQTRGAKGERQADMTVRAQFVVLAGGVFGGAKGPRVAGMDMFEGPVMHTARWDYGVSGGSVDDPRLTGFVGKRVGIVGTAATAVQVVPQVAKWAGRVVVFQRTAVPVGERGQRATDEAEWRAMTARPGWQRARIDKWNCLVSGDGVCGDDDDDDDNGDHSLRDGWTQLQTTYLRTGGRHNEGAGRKSGEKLIEEALAADTPRMERLRARVDDVVTKDQASAEALKSHVPTWCRRPVFSDDYLDTFNKEHVSIVDTSDTRGIERFTHAGVVAAGREHRLDVVVLATGYGSPFGYLADPSVRTGMRITGRGGVDFVQQWAADGSGTLWGILKRGFPNLAFAGLAQGGISHNFTSALDAQARHTAHVLSAAMAWADKTRGDGGGGRDGVSVEPTEQAEAEWAAHIGQWAAFAVPQTICGPCNFNNERPAAQLSADEAARAARAIPYPLGQVEYERVLERWRREGSLEDLSLAVAGMDVVEADEVMGADEVVEADNVVDGGGKGESLPSLQKVSVEAGSL